MMLYNLRLSIPLYLLLIQLETIEMVLTFKIGMDLSLITDIFIKEKIEIIIRQASLIQDL